MWGWTWKPKEVLGPLGLELQAIMSYSTWVLSTELKSSGRVARSLNDPTLSTAPSVKHCKRWMENEDHFQAAGLVNLANH